MTQQVPNKVIANASGQVVRLDIENSLKATAANNFGPLSSGGELLPCEFIAQSDQSKKLFIRATGGGSVADQTHTPLSERATLNEVGNLDEANLGLLPKAGGTMTGQILGDDGSGAGSPAYAFDNDTDTGMYRISANTMGFSTSGSTRVTISDAGLDVVNGLPIRLQDSSGAPFVSLKSPSSLSGNISLTLPSSITNGGFLQTDGSGNLSFSVIQGVPTGSVFCMAVINIPSGYLECNGATVSRTTYAALFAVIGTQYGSTNNSNFKVPDLRGEFVRGVDRGRGVDSGRQIASSQGGQNESHNHSASASSSSSVSDPGHFHNLLYGEGSFGGSSGAVTPRGTSTPTTPGINNRISTKTTGISVSTSTSVSVANRGGSESRPRNVAMMYIIKV